MRRRLAFVLLVGLAACKGDRKHCEEVCRHVFEVTYWEKADPEIAAAPEAERDKLKRRKLAEYSSKVENGIELCVNQCSSANNKDQNACLLKAKTTKDVVACTK